MTRKEALTNAISLINAIPKTDETEIIVKKLLEITNDIPITNWTEATIFDTLDQFVIDNKRNPTTTDLKAKDMPPHPVIKLRFGFTAKEFLKKHYPQPQALCNSKAFGSKSASEWLEIFKEEYNRTKPTSAADFNEKRLSGLPTWITFARILGGKNWIELLEIANIAKIYSSRVPQTLSKNRTSLVVSHTSKLENDLAKLSG